MINGITELHMMKLDVLSYFDSVKIATEYVVDGKKTNIIPFDLTDVSEIIYEEFKGFQSDLENTKDYEQLPESCKKYISFIEDYLEIPIKLVSVGPNRTETIIK